MDFGKCKPGVLNAYRHPDFCKFDLRDAETFFFQSGSSHISLNKILFFGKAVVPTFYPFARLCETIWAKTNLLLV
ncbi:hypothetical protein [Leptospira interrogans]|uniref:Uncharacterized protein n=1 Tax=Leptospira interrogans serogroup Icterohaemorrhagiae serovar Lai (strain 56601) TaxID=189518 RepID=Q8F1E9_LEPIN|nr:hypothetical protein [Leptospira interrogans]AAN50385.2 hypothetical protein LA_3187 [Leptospira interrogans serovar Lai str. 56601]AER03342.1 hypothetical protein LIF_A2562 [Leptospira interrogans serovar Lai str. IPAV]